VRLRLNPRPAARLGAYELGAWDGYLLPALLPDAIRVRARPGRRPHAWELPRGLRQLVFHVNLSDARGVPPQRAEWCRALEARGVRVLNGALLDITKRHVQNTCKRLGLGDLRAPAEGDLGELLIVKTNRNYGGRPEARLSPAARTQLGVIDDGHTPIDPRSYRVAPRGEIEAACFRSPGLAVERYLEDGAGTLYRAYLLGSRAVLCEYSDPRPVKKMHGATYVAHHLLDLGDRPRGDARVRSAHSKVAAFCHGAGMDFGALDLCPDASGELFLVDANPTPYWGEGLRRPSWFDHLLSSLGDPGYPAG